MSFFGKNEFGALILSVFEKNLFLGCEKTKKRSQLRSSVEFSIGKMKADKIAESLPTYRILAFEI